VGIYLIGNLVRLSAGEIAVVVQTHAPDPYRPRLRVLASPDGTPIDTPCDIDL
jgi:hypothetical protein